MIFTEHGFEPIRGLPARLPAGEEIVWQGAPRWRSLFLHACYLRALGLYFGLIAAWQAITAVYDGRGLGGAAVSASWILVPVLVLVVLLAFYCWLVVRTSVYTITTRRLVMRVGIALPITLNLPFRTIESAELGAFADGTGNIVMTIKPGDRVGFLVLWPHTKPWRFARPQPMLRSVADAATVAEMLGRALSDAEAARLAAEEPAATGADTAATQPSPTAVAMASAAMVAAE